MFLAYKITLLTEFHQNRRQGVSGVVDLSWNAPAALEYLVVIHYFVHVHTYRGRKRQTTCRDGDKERNWHRDIQKQTQVRGQAQDIQGKGLEPGREQEQTDTGTGKQPGRETGTPWTDTGTAAGTEDWTRTAAETGTVISGVSGTDQDRIRGKGIRSGQGTVSTTGYRDRTDSDECENTELQRQKQGQSVGIKHGRPIYVERDRLKWLSYSVPVSCTTCKAVGFCNISICQRFIWRPTLPWFIATRQFGGLTFADFCHENYRL